MEILLGMILMVLVLLMILTKNGWELHLVDVTQPSIARNSTGDILQKQVQHRDTAL